MADYDRTRDDYDWRGREDDRAGWEGRRYETDYDRDRSRRRDFGGRHAEDSFGRGSRDYSGSTPYRADEGGYGRGDYGRDPGRGWRSESSWGDRDAAYRPRYGAGSSGREGRTGSGRSMSEIAFGRDASGRDRQDYGFGGDTYGRDFGTFGRDNRVDRGGYGNNRFDREDRGFLERAGDEVASWFGDDDAERRRRQDRRDDEGTSYGYGTGYGEHSGRGPKNYQRSDDRIRDDVNDRLTDDHRLDASEIDVAVSQREVTLSGTVRNRHDKRRAEDIAEAVSGVSHVQNNLRVQQTTDASWTGATSDTTRTLTGTGATASSTSTSETGLGWRDTTKV